MNLWVHSYSKCMHSPTATWKLFSGVKYELFSLRYFLFFFLRAVLKAYIHYILHCHVLYVCFNMLSVQVGHQSPMKLDLEVSELGKSIIKGIVHQKFFTYCNVVPNLKNIQKKRFIRMSTLLFTKAFRAPKIARSIIKVIQMTRDFLCESRRVSNLINVQFV